MRWQPLRTVPVLLIITAFVIGCAREYDRGYYHGAGEPEASSIRDPYSRSLGAPPAAPGMHGAPGAPAGGAMVTPGTGTAPGSGFRGPGSGITPGAGY